MLSESPGTVTNLTIVLTVQYVSFVLPPTSHVLYVTARVSPAGLVVASCNTYFIHLVVTVVGMYPTTSERRRRRAYY